MLPSIVSGDSGAAHTERPHGALGYLTPKQYAQAKQEALAHGASAKDQAIEVSLTADSRSLPD